MKYALITLICITSLFITGCDNKSESVTNESSHDNHIGTVINTQAERPTVVNAVCPIMGSAIDPKNVPDNLYRQFKGQGVGFCCGGCPAAWDKLSDDEKAAKLSSAIIK